MFIVIDYNPDLFDKIRAQCKNGAVPPISPEQLRTLGPHTKILAGNNTTAYGGGISGTGYVMQGARGTYSIQLSREDVQNRRIFVR